MKVIKNKNMNKLEDFFFNSIIIEEKNGKFSQNIKKKKNSELPAGDLLIKVQYSSLNYKDALSFSGNKGVTKYYPHTPGIDAMGIIESSRTEKFKPGDKVLVTGFDLGMNTPGGFGEYISVSKDWATFLPDDLRPRDSMVLGTAGITAGLCVNSLQDKHTIKDQKAIVTGATGGVGCIAIKLLAKLGANVTAITGKEDSKEFLYSIGSNEVILRNEFLESVRKPMGKGRWDIAVDVVGGEILSGLIASMSYGGTITCCGLVASPEFDTTVFPFILRGISLIGIDSGEAPIHEKTKIWEKFAVEWKLDNLDSLHRVVDMEDMMNEIKKILNGEQVGRIVLKHN